MMIIRVENARSIETDTVKDKSEMEEAYEMDKKI